MGLIRKTMSAATLGGVKYTSKREAQTKAAIAEARLANAQARTLRQGAAPDAVSREASEALAVQHVEAHLAGEYPKWKLTTRELVLLRRARKESAGS